MGQQSKFVNKTPVSKGNWGWSQPSFELLDEAQHTFNTPKSCWFASKVKSCYPKFFYDEQAISKQSTGRCQLHASLSNHPTFIIGSDAPTKHSNLLANFQSIRRSPTPKGVKCKCTSQSPQSGSTLWTHINIIESPTYASPSTNSSLLSLI